MNKLFSRLRLSEVKGSAHTYLLVLLFTATVPTIKDCTPVCVDNDHDGYGANCTLGPDCDDNDSSVHPGAEERLNGSDDNCNVLFDEGLNITVDGTYHYAYNENGIISYPNGNLSQVNASCFSITPLYAGYDNTTCPTQPELEMTFFDASYSAIGLERVARDKTRTSCTNCYYLDYDRTGKTATFRVGLYGGANVTTSVAAAGGVSTKGSDTCQCPKDETPCREGYYPHTVRSCFDQIGSPQCIYTECASCDSAIVCGSEMCIKYKKDSCECIEFAPQSCPSGQIKVPNEADECECRSCAAILGNTNCSHWNTSHNECLCEDCPLDQYNCSGPEKTINTQDCKCECSPYFPCHYGKKDDCTCKDCDIDCWAGAHPDSTCTCKCDNTCPYGYIAPDSCLCKTCDLNCPVGQPNSDCSACECQILSDCKYGFDFAACACKSCGVGDAPPCPTCTPPLHLDGKNGCVCPDGTPAAVPSQCQQNNEDNCFWGSDVSDANRSCHQGSDGRWCCKCNSPYGGDPSAVVCCGPNQVWDNGRCTDCGGSDQSCLCSNCVSRCDSHGKCMDDALCDSNRCAAKNTGLVAGCWFNDQDCSCNGCYCTNGATWPNCGESSSSSSSSSSGENSCGPDGQCPDGTVCVDGTCIPITPHCFCVGGNHPGDGCYSDINCWHDGTPPGICVCPP